MEFHSVKSKSGNIVSAGYEPANSRVVVNFQGGTSYEYKGVPPNVWASFSQTFDNADASTGSHFHKHIRKFPCVKLDK